MNDITPSDELTEEARRDAFRHELRLTPEAGGGRIVGRISKKVMWSFIAALAVLGLGGQAVEHYFGNLGLPTSSGPTTTFTTPTTLPGDTTATSTPTSLADAALLDLKLIGTATATGFALTDQHAHPYGTAQAQGKTTLITFYNKNCNDICPVLGAELHDLLVDLGNQASRVNIVIVNTDPFSYGASSDPLALSVPGLSAYPEVHFVTGPLAQLNAVWSAYGVKVDVGASANEVSHNSLIYFLGPHSQLEAYAKPFAAESKTGQFSLGTSDITRFAQALRFETSSLLS